MGEYNEEDEKEQSFYSDPDNFYDIMRDDSGCELWNDLCKLKNFYVDKPTGTLIYFSNNPERFWESVKSTAEYELKEIKKDINQTKIISKEVDNCGSKKTKQ
jgi:hypothetical protein